MTLEKEIYPIAEVQSMFGVDRKTIWRWEHRPVNPLRISRASNLRRFMTRENLEAFIRQSGRIQNYRPIPKSERITPQSARRPLSSSASRATGIPNVVNGELNAR